MNVEDGFFDLNHQSVLCFERDLWANTDFRAMKALKAQMLSERQKGQHDRTSGGLQNCKTVCRGKPLYQLTKISNRGKLGSSEAKTMQC